MGFNRRLLNIQAVSGLADTGLYGTQVSHFGFEQTASDYEGNNTFSLTSMSYSTTSFEGNYSLTNSTNGYATLSGDSIRSNMIAGSTGWGLSFWWKDNYIDHTFFYFGSMGIFLEAASQGADLYLGRWSGTTWNYTFGTGAGRNKNQFWVINYNGTTLSVYLNNSLNCSTTDSFTRRHNALWLGIDRNSSTAGGGQKWDAMRFFNAPLTSEQRTELYQQYP